MAVVWKCRTFAKYTYWCVCIYCHMHRNKRTLHSLISDKSSDNNNLFTKTSYACNLFTSSKQAMLAPFSSRRLHVSTFPCAAAKCSGVRPPCGQQTNKQAAQRKRLSGVFGEWTSHKVGDCVTLPIPEKNTRSCVYFCELRRSFGQKSWSREDSQIRWWSQRECKSCSSELQIKCVHLQYLMATCTSAVTKQLQLCLIDCIRMQNPLFQEKSDFCTW